MAQTKHGTEEPTDTGQPPEAADAPAGQVAGKIRVTVRRLDRLEATSVIGGRGAGFSATLS